MSFTLTIGQLVNRLSVKLAVADKVSLEALWNEAALYTDAETLDGFQKNVLWRGLMAIPGEPLFEIHARNDLVPFDRDLQYGDLLVLGAETEVTLRPTEQCQFRYLTNTDDYALLKTSLGEMPFALLAVIARHGEAGILNADLAREANQDIRSIRLRIAKLEQAGLVVCRNVYIKKKHTTCSVHVRFAGPLLASAGKDEVEESLEVSRDVKKLKLSVMAALKAAPNNLRGFSDLRKELGLDVSRSASKFFRGICIKMHRQGFIEKVQVELPGTKQRVYAISFVKDMPPDFDNAQDFQDLDYQGKDSFEDSDSDGEETPDGAVSEIPVLNKIFPLYHQIFQQVYASGTRGITSGEINKRSLGAVEYRPNVRLFESLPSYLSNSKNLKPFKKYTEPYDEYSVTKVYESENKIRFYKYFATPFCTEEKPAPKEYKFVVKPFKLSLEALQKKLHVAPIKISNQILMDRKRRLTSCDGSPEPEPINPAKKPKRTYKKKGKEQDALDSVEVAIAAQEESQSRSGTQSPSSNPRKEDDLGNIDSALTGDSRSSRRRRAAPKSFAQIETLDEAGDSGDEYTPKNEDAEELLLDENEDEFVDNDDASEANASENYDSEGEKIKKSSKTGTSGGSKSSNRKGKNTEPDTSDLEDILMDEADNLQTDDASATKTIKFITHTPVAIPKAEPVQRKRRRNERRKRHQSTASNAANSLKAFTRRDYIMDIIREEGGAFFKTVTLCRKLDKKLGVDTKTDSKTLSRDIAFLKETGALDAVKVVVELEGRSVEKRVLIMKDPAHRPTPEFIEAMKVSYAEELSKSNMRIFQRRLIQSDMKLYVEEARVPSPTTRVTRGRGRLATLGQDEYQEPEAEIDPERDVENRANEPEDLDILEKIKRARRPRKAVAGGLRDYGPKRPRRSIKLERPSATIVFRSVVISKAFFRDAIDYDAIASLVGGIDGESLRQKWGTLRRSFGGINAVNKALDTFQSMVLQGIEDGLISEENLLEGDLRFFLEYWTRFDKSSEYAILDDSPLFPSFAENLEEYAFHQASEEVVSSLTEKLEFQSMRQKEFILGQQIFSCETNPEPVAGSLDEVTSILKSIFATENTNFDPAMIKTLLGKYGDDSVRSATNAALKAKEIRYLAFDDTQKFVLGEPFKSALFQRSFPGKFFHQAAAFKETLADISAVGKGLILSQGISPGEVACLLELISDGLVDISRIDRTLNFENYESRLVDKEQIGCDVVVQVNTEKTKALHPAKASVPFKAVCQPVWIGLNAEINKDLWTKIVISLLAHVVYRPGINASLIHERMRAALSYSDFQDAIGWLMDTGCVRKLASGGFVATNCWQYILGR